MSRTLLATLALAAAVGLVTAGRTDSPPAAGPDLQELSQQVQSALDDLRSKATFPGVSVGFVLADGRSAGVASGLADVENKVPLTPSDRLLAGSIGKTFVAAVILQLVEEGKLGLDDKVEKWIG